MQCPICGKIYDPNLNQCENCGLIFSKYTNIVKHSKSRRNKRRIRKIIKLSLINILIVFILTVSLVVYYRYKRSHFLFNNSMAGNSHIIITPIGNGHDEFGIDYVYISGKLSLKQSDSTIIPLSKAIISFEDQEGEERREILSQSDGFYEVSLKHDIYMLTVSYPEYNLKFREKLDLRKATKLTIKNIVLN